VTRLPSILKLSMPAQMNDTGLPLSGLALRWIDQTMSSGVNRLPSCQNTSSRTSIHTFALSSFQPQAVSKAGSKERSGR
jgi:hypothetical protein